MLPNRARVSAWLVVALTSVVALCSIFVTTCGFSSEFRFGNLIYAVSLVRDQVTVRASLSARILTRLEEREQLEPDPWLRDDLRIAWHTVALAAKGEPTPHVIATCSYLGLHPDNVFQAITERRKSKLGSYYERLYDEHGNWRGGDLEVPPKKPAQSASVYKTRRQTGAAAA